MRLDLTDDAQITEEEVELVTHPNVCHRQLDLLHDCTAPVDAGHLKKHDIRIHKAIKSLTKNNVALPWLSFE
jgi:hypothetical protein